jgi:hypothetical protein
MSLRWLLNSCCRTSVRTFEDSLLKLISQYLLVISLIVCPLVTQALESDMPQWLQQYPHAKLFQQRELVPFL